MPDAHKEKFLGDGIGGSKLKFSTPITGYLVNWLDHDDASLYLKLTPATSFCSFEATDGLPGTMRLQEMKP